MPNHNFYIRLIYTEAGQWRNREFNVNSVSGEVAIRKCKNLLRQELGINLFDDADSTEFNPVVQELRLVSLNTGDFDGEPYSAGFKF